jgi:hypothetical protein
MRQGGSGEGTMLEPQVDEIPPSQTPLFPSADDEVVLNQAHEFFLTVDELRTYIRDEFLSHLALLGLDAPTAGASEPSKDLIRAYHSAQRQQLRMHERRFVERYGPRLLLNFASGDEVDPTRVSPVLCPIASPESADGALFRLATLLWSVPVSRGFGRRMRYLVRDAANGKLMGIFALTDPVFNLRARDEWIGWQVDQRREQLVNVMDAYVAGAVPPYSQLLGGKVVAALMTSQEVVTDFANKYGNTRGIISGRAKHAHLVLVTVTSALGRSSLYNRLRIPGLLEFERVGMTGGWGHFQVPGALFARMRELLKREEHPYASGHQYGQGPNWRMRVVREALKRVDLDPDLLRHGIAREIYAAPLTPDWREVLRGDTAVPLVERPAAAELGDRTVARWLIPRAERDPAFRRWTLRDTWKLLTNTAVPPGGT